MGDNTKQVRVDNWGIFFLQRLQCFFSKTDYCDMTLQFEGNVQLKVHRLVMNACTEYFQFLEQTCTLEENVIMMPSDLQADVIVPIVNFMYTGMLEFHLSIFDRLYKTAQVMNITILTKLLDAQKQPYSMKAKRKLVEPLRKPPPSKLSHSELPLVPLPGRKLPVWKRKNIPNPPEPLRNTSIDPLLIPDNTPKPTRFEWPDEELPTLNLMETTFEDISYTSRPLLTREEEHRASTSFDDLKQLPNSNTSSGTHSKKRTSPSLDMEEMKNYVKEQKIRSGLSQDEEAIDNDLIETFTEKRKGSNLIKNVTKKVRFDETDSKTTTISIAADGKAALDLNHEKIVTEILKKYPQLVKKNKNIRLKIMAKSKTISEAKVENIQVKSSRIKQITPSKTDSSKPYFEANKTDNAPWVCVRCSTDDEPMEFVLYYLYRKHMTDIHNEKFDPKLCKYCGHRCNKLNLLMYHMYTRHGMKPPPNYTFPKCDRCPYIALSSNILNRHKIKHGKNEVQCLDCKLAFTSKLTLTSHMQITGHIGKTTNSYDCQYCTKRLQNCVNLFNHVRSQHKNEAIRDGIVSIDEVDDVDILDEEENNLREEYILPEVIDETIISKKVNVISNIKVDDHQNNTRQLSLEPSSEAEALNNVATGIATSLGLVDIVVLNDNQQLFLQSNEQNFSNQNDQSEYMLPELTGREAFTQEQNQVMSGDVGGMLTSGDIASTDELVMVLTDHDYGDNQEEINNENSNIVVLYSHPVDGQQDQFITSQGNIMVNSQTGLFEIRNGATITTTANQVVMTNTEPHIESIEMIQREIESGGEVKQVQETLYEENKSACSDADDKLKEEIEIDEAGSGVAIPETLPQTESLIESLEQGEQLEFISPPLEQSHDKLNETDTSDVQKQEPNSEENPPEYENQENNSEVDQNQYSSNDEVKAEIIKEPEPLNETTDEQDFDLYVKEEPQKTSDNNVEAKEGDEVPPPPPPPPPPSESETVETNTLEFATPINDDEEPLSNQEQQPAQSPEQLAKNEKPNEPKLIDTTEQREIAEESAQELMETNEIPETIAEEIKNPEPELSQSDTSTSQFNDENSQSSQESPKDSGGESAATKIAILDDWEDTDSQQSDQKEDKAKTVDKLMDDWEEEDEEEKK